MPTERLSMRLIRDLLRLKSENGLSSRAIAASLGISKGAVCEYLQRAQVAGLSWPLPDGMTDAARSGSCFRANPRSRLFPALNPTGPRSIRSCAGPR